MIRGLIGEHLGHSYSKRIHETLGGYPYELIEVDRDELDRLMKERNFDALNVTIPYKQTVMQYLDEIDPKAQRIKAVNTIVNRDGKLIGYNTDYDGFAYMLQHIKIQVAGKKVLLLGNGGAAKAAEAVLQDMGAKEIIKVKKNPSEETWTYSQAYSVHSDAQVIVNASPVGMYPECEECPIDLSQFKRLESVADVIYNPSRTALLVEAEKRGCRIATGLSMLVYQAVVAIEKFTGLQVSQKNTTEMIRTLSHEKQNLVLIGMPGSGKSTIGQKLSGMIGRTMIDLDQLIEQEIGMTIKEYFEDHSEKQFRKIESRILKQAAFTTGQIIATGGGVVKDWDNVRRLRQSGKVYFLDRDIELLAIDDKRPLSMDRASLKKLYDERIDLYRQACDRQIINDSTPDAACDEIYRDWMEH